MKQLIRNKLLIFSCINLIHMPVWSTDHSNQVSEDVEVEITAPSTRQPDFISAVKVAYDNITDTSLKPNADPRTILNEINETLYSKYFAFGSSSFQSRDIQVDPDSQKHIKNYVKNNSEDLGDITDPKPMVFFLRMLQPLKIPTQFSIKLEQHELCIITQNFSSLSRLPALCAVASIKSQKVHFDFQKLYDSLSNNVNFIYFDENIYPKKQPVLASVITEFNQIFNIHGVQYYDISTDTKALSQLFNSWFNNNRQLMRFEVEEWKNQASRLNSLENDYRYIHKNLDTNNNRLYSGLSVGPYSLSLLRTTKQESAETRADLRNMATEHYNDYEQQREQYEAVKPSLSIFQKTLSWFDEITEILTKRGRLS